MRKQNFYKYIYKQKMIKIRKIIRNIINEVLDKPKIPDNLQMIKSINKFVYKFNTTLNNYCIMFKTPDKEFTPVGLTKNEKINDVIIKSKNIFDLNWGVCDKNDEPIDGVETNAREELFVFNSVFGIIEKFIKDNNPEIIFYRAIEKRKNVYDYMLRKGILSNYHVEYGVMNTFLIKKELI
jgi:hypothetical protein